MDSKMKKILKSLKDPKYSEYKKLLTENDIDDKNFEDLDQQDFQNLGFSLGTAKKLVKAKKKFFTFEDEETDETDSEASKLLYETLKEKVTKQFAKQFNMEDFRPISGVNEYPYAFYNLQEYNSKTIQFLSSKMSMHEDNDKWVQGSGYSFTQEYSDLWTRLSWNLSEEDRNLLVESQNRAQSSLESLTRMYLTNFKDVDIEVKDKTGSDLTNHVLTKILSWGDNVTLETLRTTTNIGKILKRTPPGGQNLYTSIYLYLQDLGRGVGIQESITRSYAIRSDIMNIITSPSKDPSTYIKDELGESHLGFTATPGYTEIENGLRNKKNSISVTIEITKEQEDSFSLSIDGGTKLGFEGDWFNIKLKGSGNYSYSKETEVKSETSVTITWSGITLVNSINPFFYDNVSRKGWFYNSPIQRAQNNNNGNTGWTFSKHKNLPDFDNDFGLIKSMVLSSQPTIDITYTGSNFSKIASKLKAEEEVKFSLFGVFKIGGDSSQTSFKKSISETEESFRITFSPPLITDTVNVFDRTAFVLGADVWFPCAVAMTSELETKEKYLRSLNQNELIPSPDNPYQFYYPVSKFFIIKDTSCLEITSDVYLYLGSDLDSKKKVEVLGIWNIGNLNIQNLDESSQDKRSGGGFIYIWNNQTKTDFGSGDCAVCGLMNNGAGHIIIYGQKSEGKYRVFLVPLCGTHNSQHNRWFRARTGAVAVEIDYPWEITNG